MGILRLPGLVQTTQPQSGPLRIDPANPLAISELFIPVSRRTLVRGYDTTVSAGVVSDIVGPPGRGIAFDATANNGLVITSNPDLVFSSLSECTVFVFRRSKDTTARASYLFGYDNGTLDRVLAHAPYSDGALYWDFGNSTASNRLSVPFTKSILPETLVFIAGSVKGREVWRNGVKIAANAATTGSRPSNTTLPVRIGAAVSSLGSDNEEIYLFGIAARAWSDAEIKAWSANPWNLTKTPQRVMLVAAAGTNTPINPGVGVLALTGYSPAVAQSANQSLTPGAGSIGITGYAPSISQPNAVNPGVGSLAITGYAPAVTQAANQAVTPGAGSLALTGYAPAVAQTAGQWVAPGAGSLTISGFAPTITQPQTVAPGLGSLAIIGYAPTVTQAINQSIVPGAGALALSGYAPSIAQSANQVAQPAAGSLSLTGYAPLVAQSVNQSIAPSVGSLTITGFAPVITQVSASPNLQPGTGVLSIVGYAPTVEQRDPSAIVGGGGAGDWRSVRDFANRLNKVHAKPTKAAKKLRRKQIEEEVLELLPDEPESRIIAPQIAQAVYRKEAQVIARWTPTRAMQPIAPGATVAEQAEAMEAEAQAAEFDAAEAIRAMVEQWQRNEVIAREIEREAEEEPEIEMLLLG